MSTRGYIWSFSLEKLQSLLGGGDGKVVAEVERVIPARNPSGRYRSPRDDGVRSTYGPVTCWGKPFGRRTGMRRFSAMLVVVVVLGMACGARAQDERPPVAPAVHKGDGWAVVAPADWTRFRVASLTTVLHLIGDGRAGVPLFDGTLSPIKAGLTLERFPNPAKSGAKELLEKDLKRLKESGEFVARGEPEVSDVTLADGTKALLLWMKFVRRENGRLSVHRKVYCADPQGRLLVVTGFITCSPARGAFVEGIGLNAFVEAHATSLVLDPDKTDLEKLKGVYEKHAWHAGGAIERTNRGNDLLEKGDHRGAIAVFREAVGLCDHVSAAHNGLAWALMHQDVATPEDVKEALREAKRAVEQTAELDYSALDTLAVACQRTGDKARALEAVRKALKLNPRHPELRQRLESIESDKGE